MGHYRRVAPRRSLGRRILGRVLGSGPGAGALVMMALFFVDLVGASIEFMGFSGDAHAYDVILHRYGRRIVLGQLEILLLYGCVGAAFGLVGSGFGRLRKGAVEEPGWRRALRGIVAALGLHAYLLARSIAHYPQLYSEAIYDHGGVRRAIEVAVTTLPVWAIDVIFGALVVGLVVRARWGWRPQIAGRKRWAIAAAPAVALVALLLVGLGFHHPVSGRHEHPNVLLIAVDSLRADRVFGPDAKRFPTLSALAARGVRFREDHVTVPRTFPSFVTLLTGRWPYHHGIRHMFPSAAQRNAIGPALPGALAKAGYRTIAVSDYAGEIFSRTPLGF